MTNSIYTFLGNKRLSQAVKRKILQLCSSFKKSLTKSCWKVELNCVSFWQLSHARMFCQDYPRIVLVLFFHSWVIWRCSSFGDLMRFWLGGWGQKMKWIKCSGFHRRRTRKMYNSRNDNSIYTELHWVISRYDFFDISK